MSKDKIITPNAARTMRRAIRETYASAREFITKARECLAKAKTSNTSYWTEQAEGELNMAWCCREDARRYRRELTACVIEKYSNLSPRAAAREAIRRRSWVS